jgi:hypothetical protein
VGGVLSKFSYDFLLRNSFYSVLSLSFFFFLESF